MRLPTRALALSSLLMARSASADVAPPPGYVEKCSVEKQRGAGEDCAACSTYFAEADACQKQYAPRGYAERCRTRGASTWTEVWCKPSSAAAVSSLAEPRDAGGGDPVPQPSALASSSAEPPAASKPTPSAAPTPDTNPAAPGTSAQQSSVPNTAPREKSGSCGACELGRPASSSTPLAWLVGLLVLRARSRRAGTSRSRSACSCR
ncbi:MAG: hypothetical protein IPM35_02165 [Myxococcales bacterium]|nr:hypothetical protein [Myxococcales bacterium]